MAKKKEVVQEEITKSKEAEEIIMDNDEYDDWDEEDDDYEENSAYEEALRLEKEARKAAKEEAMKQAFKRDDTVGIRKNYNFLLGYGTFVKILSIVGAVIVGIAYLVLAILLKEPTLLISAIVLIILLMLAGYFTEALLKWLAYILKILHEINKKLK